MPASPHHPSRADRLIAALAHWAIAHPLLSMLGSLLVVGALLAGAAGFHYSLDHRVFFGSDNPQLQAFEKLQEDYAKTDTVLIVLQPEDREVFSAGFLAVLQQLTEDSWQIPYSQRVESLTNFQHVQVDGDSIATHDLVQDPATLGPAQIAKIREVALAEPFLRDSLVNPEGSLTGVRVTLNMPGLDQKREIPEVVGHIRGMVAKLKERHPQIGVHLAGQTIANQAFPEESQADSTRVWPWFALTMMLVLVYLFRSVKAMLVVFLTCILAVLAGAGFIGWFKPTINDSVIVAPVMILALCFCDGIHLVVSWIQGMHAGLDRRAAMVQSLQHNIGAMFTTTLLTALGFLTLHFNDSPPFRIMGYIVAAGVFMALLLSIFFSAPLLASLPGKPPRKIPSLMYSDSPQMERFANFLIRRRYPLLVGLMLPAAGLIALVPLNQINDDPVRYYSPNTQFRQDAELVNDKLTGIGEINYSLPAGGTDGVLEPEYLRRLDAYGQWLKQQPDVVQVNSLVDIIKRVNQVMHGDDPAFYRVPDSREEIAQYLLQYELSLPFGMDLNYLLRFDRSEARVRVSVGTSGGQKIIALDEAAQAWQKDNLPQSMRAAGASLSLMFAHIGERSIGGMFGGMLLSLLIDALLTATLFANWRHGVTCFIGNQLPIGMAFGVWGWLNGNIDLGLTLVLGIAFAVVIDGTIHFISKYEKARRELRLSTEDAVRYAQRNIGYALITTSLVLGLGFAWLANSNIQLTVNTAIVLCLSIAFAMLMDVVLLPLLYLIFDRRKLPAPVGQEAPEGAAATA